MTECFKTIIRITTSPTPSLQVTSIVHHLVTSPPRPHTRLRTHTLLHISPPTHHCTPPLPSHPYTLTIAHNGCPSSTVVDPAHALISLRPSRILHQTDDLSLIKFNRRLLYRTPLAYGPDTRGTQPELILHRTTHPNAQRHRLPIDRYSSRAKGSANSLVMKTI